MEPTTKLEQSLTARLLATGIDTDLTRRWEQGVDHHPQAQALAHKIGALDWLFGNDQLGLEFGGDGDNGEHLTYLLDILFELQEKDWVNA